MNYRNIEKYAKVKGKEGMSVEISLYKSASGDWVGCITLINLETGQELNTDIRKAKATFEETLALLNDLLS